MKLSILILNWNSKDHLRRCLGSLVGCTTVKHEIIVVDNGSTDGSVEILADLQRRRLATVIFNRKNLGVGPARNQGFAIAEGEYVLSLDVDTEVKDMAVDELIYLMDSDPGIGLCGARLHGSDGHLQYTCREFPTLQSKLARQLPHCIRIRALKRSEMLSWDHRQIRDVGYVIGACQVIRRAALDSVGFYDPKIPYGPEDVDLCLRMWRGGWRVTYHGGAVILHHEQRITKRVRNLLSRATWSHIRTLIYYFHKHAYLFHAPIRIGDSSVPRLNAVCNGGYDK